jgi:hypothetical protein
MPLSRSSIRGKNIIPRWPLLRFVVVVLLGANRPAIQAFIIPQSTPRRVFLVVQQELPTASPAPTLLCLRSSRRMAELGLSSSAHHHEPETGREQQPRGHGLALRILKRFARSLFKGLALPFPILQNIAFSDDKSTTKDTASSFSIGISVREGLLALFVYLLTGVIVYTKVLERWSIVDALYFTSVCFSTVGYGDLSPTNPASQLFTCVFGMIGIAFLGAAVAAVGGKVVQAEVAAAQTAAQVSRRRLLHLFDNVDGRAFRKDRVENTDSSNSKALMLQQQEEPATEDFQKQVQRDTLDGAQQNEATLGAIARRLAVKSVSSLSIIFAGGLIMGHLNKAAKPWSIPQSLYFALVTGTYEKVVVMMCLLQCPFR